MTRRFPFNSGRVVLVCAVVALWASGSPAATVVLESAVLGPTPYPGGQDLSATQLVGWRFHVDQSLLVTEVGGHLLGLNDQLFAALVKLAALDALPTGSPTAGSPFSPTEVLAHTLFTPPLPSGDILVPLAASLGAGDYALVFGSGQFEATGSGAIPNYSAQSHIAPTTADSFIFWKQTTPGVFAWRAGLSSQMRLVVQGQTLVGTADFNLDDTIDQLDAEVWREHHPLASGATIFTGDADGDGDNDGKDYLAWQRQLGLTQSAGLRAVPEPRTLVAAAVALLLLGGRASRYREICFVSRDGFC